MPERDLRGGRDIAHLHGVVATIGTELEGGDQHALTAGRLALRERFRLRRHRVNLPNGLAEIAERRVLVLPHLGRQAEHALADDVALDLVGAARDAQ